MPTRPIYCLTGLSFIWVFNETNQDYILYFNFEIQFIIYCGTKITVLIFILNNYIEKVQLRGVN